MDRTGVWVFALERGAFVVQILAESAEDIAACRPEAQLREDHFEACYAAARNGVILRRQVLDSLTPRGRYRILHDFPDYLREWNAAHRCCLAAIQAGTLEPQRWRDYVAKLTPPGWTIQISANQKKEN